MLCITIIIMILTLFSTMIILSKHPLSMGLILLIQTILIALLTGNLYLNFWFSYILFLIMIGGMMILFIYMTNIASNEKFQFSHKMFSYTLIMTFLFLILIYFYYELINQYLFTKNFTSNMNFYLNLNKFINFPLNFILIMMISYLLITLIAVVKITDINLGPLRKN
uniref:NADH-ubiquinone oxidoreductase chain 6 n=1 Tax=Staphylinidae sp. BMNH 1274706 TaxID=1796599 RepID=A0A140EG29_9COLE|nr:NADH dehydrogenase subunit 6 [Staphylinidae sp. BMNH 1274706]